MLDQNKEGCIFLDNVNSVGRYCSLRIDVMGCGSSITACASCLVPWKPKGAHYKRLKQKSWQPFHVFTKLY